MKSAAIAALAGANIVLAFPFVAHQPGINTAIFRRQQADPNLPGGANKCAYNPNHIPAVGINSKYPYNNAKNGTPGDGKGGYLVPHPDDPDHQFIAPDYTKDIRGPCPGLNVAANYGFLARDGITTYNELVDAQQNVYNVGYDLANVLAILGLTLTDGDLVTEKLSIGCDATNRTSVAPLVTGSEPGLDGHNKFEADTSLTRDDYFSHVGDNFNFNGTLFGMMTETTGGNYDLHNLALYRYQRYQQSRVENANFYFGPFSLLLFGAASFLYELMPGGPDYKPDYPTISSFFGAEKQSDGTYTFTGEEKIPANWTNRLTPYSVFDVGVQIFEMYLLYPVEFGGSTGTGTFNALPDWADIKNGTLQSADAAAVSCLLYQLATERVPSYANGLVGPTADALSFTLGKLNPIFQNLCCPIVLS